MGQRNRAASETGQVARPGQGSSEQERREAREQRLLDAAASLILRYGYHKTTIDDIAREASVSRGTFYLHFQTRDTLLTTLIVREKIALTEDLKQRISGDPAGATLRGLLKHSALALMQRPLLKALLLRDAEVFGRVVEREQHNAGAMEALTGFTRYLQRLYEQGLVRTDLPLQTLISLFSSIFLGFFLATPLLPDAFKLSDEQLAEMMAETGHRVLERGEPASPAALRAAADSLNSFLDQGMAIGQIYNVSGQEIPPTAPPTRGEKEESL